MLIFILTISIINLLLLDFFIYKSAKTIFKKLNLVGNLNLTDLDEDFWE